MPNTDHRLAWRTLDGARPGVELADYGPYEACVFPSEGLWGYQVVSDRGVHGAGEAETKRDAKRHAASIIGQAGPRR